MEQNFVLSLTPIQVKVLFSILSERSVSVNSKLQKFQFVDSIKDGLFKDWLCEYQNIDDILNKLVLGLSIED